MMRHLICSLLVVLFALGGVMQHGQNAAAVEMTGQHVMSSMAVSVVADTHEHGKSKPITGHQRSEACAIVCLGTPTPSFAAAEIAPGEVEQSLRWRLMAVRHEGRLIGPGLRPPRSI